jgi:hypothetical protein
MNDLPPYCFAVNPLDGTLVRIHRDSGLFPVRLHRATVKGEKAKQLMQNLNRVLNVTQSQAIGMMKREMTMAVKKVAS